MKKTVEFLWDCGDAAEFRANGIEVEVRALNHVDDNNYYLVDWWVDKTRHRGQAHERELRCKSKFDTKKGEGLPRREKGGG